MPRRSTTSRTATATSTTRARARRPHQTAPEPAPAPTPVASATTSAAFQARVQALLDVAANGADAVAEALRRGDIRVRLPRAGRSGSRAPRNGGLPCTPRQGTFLLHCAEHGTFQKGTSKVREELYKLGLTDSNAVDARLTDAGRAACEALRAAGVSVGGWTVQR
jgi:hypothetical protein